MNMPVCAMGLSLSTAYLTKSNTPLPTYTCKTQQALQRPGLVDMCVEHGMGRRRSVRKNKVDERTLALAI